MEVLGGFLLVVAAVLVVISYFVETKYSLTRVSLTFVILAVAALHFGQRLLQ